MAEQPRIAIVGAGLGGPIAAIFLQRYGYDVTVYEQAPRLERIGAGINLSPNITRVFRHLGLFDRMTELGVVPRARLRKNGYTGELTFAVPVDELPERYGAPHLIMHRGDLQEVLTSAVTPGTLELGKRLVDVTETSTAARLAFTDGTTAEADIVIGADGINSRLRELLFGVEAPIYAGEVAYRSIYPLELVGDLDVPDHTKWWGTDRHILIYFITRARDVIYFVTGVPEPDWGSDDYGPRPADPRKLRDAFAGFCPAVTRVLEAAPAATAWPIIERPPLPLWSRGRIVLLGDACHAMRPHMGQGAAMAIEDGVMLARCIDRFHGQDPPAIFALYETQRHERASKVQLGSRGDDWMRYGMDAGWLYGYDVLNVPLEPKAVRA